MNKQEMESTQMIQESNKIPPRELAFDIDGVIADSFKTFIDTARNDYGYEYEYEDITDYDFRSVVDIDESTVERIIQKILDNPVDIGIEPVKGSIEVLTRLSHLCPLLFVTARPDENGIREWFEKELRKVDMGTIHIEATGSHHEKIPILEKYGKKYFVEDRLETCYLLKNTSIVPIVFDQPWNRLPHPFRMVKNWDEISSMIDW